MNSQQQEFTRRQALKALAAAAGGLALNFIPKTWASPIVSIGTLPAHAQISDCPGAMCAIAITTTMVEGELAMEYGDFDFSMCTPNGYYIWGGSSGDGGTSSPDNIDFDPRVDNETLDIGTAVTGTYSLYLEHFENVVPLAMTVHITTAAGIHSTSLTLSETRAVADVTFPGGIVAWRSDVGFPGCGGDRARNKGK
ncbi:MAG: twin-arginine translocation signal domain-containing protein [Anaerolineae bacterium]|nr:twin-arginine translocation signal domain-containing protein [Anaerolineae bacterium]